MTIVSEYFSQDGIRKTIVRRTGTQPEPYEVCVFINGEELRKFNKTFKHIEVAEWYAEEWIQK